MKEVLDDAKKNLIAIIGKEEYDRLLAEEGVFPADG